MRPHKHDAQLEIIGSVLKDAREKKNLARAEFANLCCLSTKMILELEEGGMSSFYTFELKIATAKRVGRVLELDEASYLIDPRATESADDTLDAPIEEQEISAPKKIEVGGTDSGPKNPPLKNETISLLELANPQVLNLEESLNHVDRKQGFKFSTAGASVVTIRVMVILFGFSVLTGAIYGLNERFNIINLAIELVNPPQKTILAIDAQDVKADEDLTLKSDSSDTSVKSPETQPAQALLSTPSEQCPYKQEAQLPSYQSPNPSKKGDTVNIKSLINQAICVVDNSGKQTVVNLESNASYAFRGTSPFVVITQDLDSVEMYFQGWRVRSPSAGAKQIKLLEVSL
ncbi:helix-turn-helix transcriptional regulator [Polynucleobacter sp. MG-Unter2-18]|uniref:helix-turn-helix domain-containing protein n=1 Tax=Polynucleobacter sp. MG-Unter2-18 TaxID=2081052 RepID=UPI001BFE8CD3|nr:helix-turn-helix domain-containing protein [Polynucleobacter sp. MG-Unter2-18]QWD94937.1 helix-turn-helix transcriptional regulator [Polynucleobacter sp. MG-Unter2-18]